jgi:hypothetical protein
MPAEHDGHLDSGEDSAAASPVDSMSLEVGSGRPKMLAQQKKKVKVRSPLYLLIPLILDDLSPYLRNVRSAASAVRGSMSTSTCSDTSGMRPAATGRPARNHGIIAVLILLVCEYPFVKLIHFPDGLFTIIIGAVSGRRS